MEFNQLVLWFLAVVFGFAGVLGLIVPVLPGTPLIFFGLFCASWAEDFNYVGTWPLITIALLAIFAYMIDFIAGSLGAKKFGASRRASLGAAIGAVAGIFFGLPGIIIGPFIGAFIAELSFRKKLQPAGEAGIGAWLGLLAGTAAKIAIGFTMIGIYVVIRIV